MEYDIEISLPKFAKSVREERSIGRTTVVKILNK